MTSATRSVTHTQQRRARFYHAIIQSRAAASGTHPPPRRHRRVRDDDTGARGQVHVHATHRGGQSGGWWNDAPPDAVPKPHATSAARGDGDGDGVDSDALTRELAMNEEDLKALLDKNAA